MSIAQPGRDSRRALALVLALLLCGALAYAHHQSVRRPGGDPVINGLHDGVLLPAQTAAAHVGRWWRDTVVAGLHGPRLAREKAALEAQVLALRAENSQLRAAQAENDRLRRLLDFQRKSPRPLLAAEVIALKPSAQADTLTLNRGARQAIRPQMVVVAPNGALVGQVIAVLPRSCHVLMITDSDSGVGGQITRPGLDGAIGVCRGERGGRLRLTDLPSDADVRPGDTVKTSGLHGVFPKGIAVGTVLSVTVDKTRSLKTAVLRPAADLDHLEEAFLIQDRAADRDTDAP